MSAQSKANDLAESGSPAQGAAITRRLARYAVEARWEDIPDEVRHHAVRSLVNFIGCAVGGARHHTVEIAVSAVRAIGGGGSAVVLGRAERFSPSDAALINGISSAVLDFDSTQAKLTNIHPSGPVVPAIAALASIRPVSGSDFLSAYVVGVEIACRIANGVFGRDNPGWHVTGVAGGLGAAAAASRLLGLDAQQMTAALGIAATQSGGLREMYGTMCKSFTPGRTAQNGLLAAMLAQGGFTSSPAAIEGATGLARVLTNRDAPESLCKDLGATYEISANTCKPFACAIVTHAAIDGCLCLRRDHGISSDNIAMITLTVSPMTLKLAGDPEPTTGLKSKFSVQHLAALSLIQGAVSHRHFTDGMARDPAVVALRARVRVEVDPDFAKDQGVVKITLNSGAIFETRIQHARGGLANPMSDADLEAKFIDLSEDGLGPRIAARLVAQCWRVADLEDFGEILMLSEPEDDRR